MILKILLGKFSFINYPSIHSGNMQKFQHSLPIHHCPFTTFVANIFPFVALFFAAVYFYNFNWYFASYKTIAGQFFKNIFRWLN